MSNSLQHYGIQGMKWGVRRFQKKDGTFTSEGRERYNGDAIHGQKKIFTARKAAIGTAAVAGVALTAYLLKHHGETKMTELTVKAEQGKAAMEKLQSTTSILSTPISQLQISEPYPGKTRQQLAKTATEIAGHISAVEPPTAYNFESLMKQNDELLKKMYADLLS